MRLIILLKKANQDRMKGSYVCNNGFNIIEVSRELGQALTRL